MKTAAGLCALTVIVLLGAPSPGLAQAGGYDIRLGADAGWLSRTIAWDDGDGERATTLDALTAALHLVFGLQGGLTLDLFGGAALSNWAGLEFRELPISLEYDRGRTTGILLGAGLDWDAYASGRLEIKAAGRFVSSLGVTKTWELGGFAVPGEAEGRPDWFRVTAGPVVTWRSLSGLSPFASVSVDWLWGKFRMAETLGELDGTQELEFDARGLIRVGLGAETAPSRSFVLRAEAGLIPRSGGIDLDAAVGLRYAF